MRFHEKGALCVVSVLLARLAFACVGDDPETVSAGTGDGGDGGALVGEGGTQSGFTLALDPTSVSLRAGATATFKARVVRQAGAIGALALSVPTGLPAGVSVTSDGVAESASEATITLTALPSAAVGATKITVRAESFDHAFFQTATLDLEVRGASGTLDTTFGTGGVATIAVAIPDAESYGSSVVVDAKGLVVVGGYSAAGGLQSPIVYRLTSSGAPDVTFGSGGRAPVTTEGHVSQVALDGSGRVVAVGDAKVAGALRNATYRFTSAGTPDPTFGGTGSYVSPIANTATSSLNALVFMGTDIIAVGSARLTAGVDAQVAIVQLTSAGADKQPGFYFQAGPADEGHPLVDVADDGKGTLIALDGQQAAYTFAPGPLTGTSLAPRTSLMGFRLAVTPAGKIVTLAGTRVRRFTSTFVLDGLDQLVGFFARALVVEPADEKIVIGGIAAATSELTISRLLPNGTADADFAGGVVRRTFPTPTTVTAMTRTTDGKLVVVAGPTAAAPKSQITVLRYWL